MTTIERVTIILCVCMALAGCGPSEQQIRAQCSAEGTAAGVRASSEMSRQVQIAVAEQTLCLAKHGLSTEWGKKL